MGKIVFFLERTRTSLLDAVDLLTENQGPIAPTRLRSVYFDVEAWIEPAVERIYANSGPPGNAGSGPVAARLRIG